MPSLNKNKSIVITIPEELKTSSKQIKFIYLALRNIIYIQKTNTYSKINLEQFAFSLLQSLDSVCNLHNIKLFKSKFEHDALFNLICSYDRNIMNRNESIIVMQKTLKPANGLKVEQLLTLYGQFMLECSLHINNDILSAETINDVYDELTTKMMIKTNKVIKNYFVSEVIDTFKLI